MEKVASVFELFSSSCLFAGFSSLERRPWRRCARMKAICLGPERNSGLASGDLGIGKLG